MHSLNRSAWTLNWAQKIMWRCSQNTLSWTCVRNIAQNNTVTSCSIKKCGESNCLSSKKPQLLTDVFQQVSHLHDPVPDEDNPGHYKKFTDLYGQETTEEFKPSKRTSNRNHTIQLNPLKQHALNRNITLECTECGKHGAVYSQKKASPRLCKKNKVCFFRTFFHLWN